MTTDDLVYLVGLKQIQIELLQKQIAELKKESIKQIEGVKLDGTYQE